MSGLRKICKALGGLTAVSASGEKVVYRWSNAKNKPVRVYPRKRK